MQQIAKAIKNMQTLQGKLRMADTMRKAVNTPDGPEGSAEAKKNTIADGIGMDIVESFNGEYENPVFIGCLGLYLKEQAEVLSSEVEQLAGTTKNLHLSGETSWKAGYEAATIELGALSKVLEARLGGLQAKELKAVKESGLKARRCMSV